MCMLDYGEAALQCAIANDYVMRRTDRRCHECGRLIAHGETYVHGQWSDQRHYQDTLDPELIHNAHLDEDYRPPRAKDWMVSIQCKHCEAATLWLGHVCGGFLYSAVKEDLFNHVAGYEDDVRTPQLTRLYRWMDAQWKRRDGTLRTVDEVMAQAQLAIAAHSRRAARFVAALEAMT